MVIGSNMKRGVFMPRKRNDILNRQSDIERWVRDGRTKAYMAKELRCKPETLNSYLKTMDIQYSGTKGWKRGHARVPNEYIPASEYVKCKNVRSHILRNKLLSEGIKECKCECCGLSEWMGEEIPLELHHKDGDHYNNDFDNLEILCPNCHAWKHRLNKTIKKIVKTSVSKYVRKTKTSLPNHCLDCGKIIHFSSLRCRACASRINNATIRRRNGRIIPDKLHLAELLQKHSILSIGKMYGVSDNGVRKWCKMYNLPYRKSDIKTFDFSKLN